MRIKHHPILQFDRPKKVHFFFEGQQLEAYAGETIAAALHAAGMRILSTSIKHHRPRGFFCGIGKCSSCLMYVNGVPNVRTCITRVTPGMTVERSNSPRLPNAPFPQHTVDTIEVEVLVVGAGPAGISAAIEAARHGVKVLLVDENPRIGGQLIKQTHKFFGSKQERAGIRGVTIATELGKEATNLVQQRHLHMLFNTSVIGYYPADTGHNLSAVNLTDKKLYTITAKAVIFGCGAQENMLAFPGNDLPGVYGAGGVQTLMNVYGIMPGEKALMVGAGNVGLIVSYQLLQAGMMVDRVVEAMPHIGGYHVHAAKLRRHGVPIFTSHSIKEVYGKDRVEGAIVVKLDKNWNPEKNSEKDISCDTICLAVGLTPSVRLLFQSGVAHRFVPEAGGHVALHNAVMETSVSGVYVVGDASGIEEASTAMVEGKIAGLSASMRVQQEPDGTKLLQAYQTTLDAMHMGPFGSKGRTAKKKILQEAVNEGL